MKYKYIKVLQNFSKNDIQLDIINKALLVLKGIDNSSLLVKSESLVKVEASKKNKRHGLWSELLLL